MMNKIVAAIVLLGSLPAFSMHSLSWNFNHDAGFGFYQPEGWSATSMGRSSRLVGPKTDFAQSEFFFASDWVSSVLTIDDLRAYVAQETGATPLALEVSGLQGFEIGGKLDRQIWILREPKNIILVHLKLRGSPEQIAEGTDVFRSIEIRKGGIEYP